MQNVLFEPSARRCHDLQVVPFNSALGLYSEVGDIITAKSNTSRNRPAAMRHRRARKVEMSVFEGKDGPSDQEVKAASGNGSPERVRPTGRKTRDTGKTAPEALTLDQEVLKLDRLFQRAWRRTYQNRNKRLG